MKKNVVDKQKSSVQIEDNEGNYRLKKFLLLIVKIPLYIISILIASITGEFPKRNKRI